VKEIGMILMIIKFDSRWVKKKLKTDERQRNNFYNNNTVCKLKVCDHVDS